MDEIINVDFKGLSVLLFDFSLDCFYEVFVDCFEEILVDVFLDRVYGKLVRVKMIKILILNSMVK